MKRRDWLASFPALNEIDDPAWHEVAGMAQLISIRPGEPVFQSGSVCENYLLIVQGSVRVQKLSENGQLITLYHLKGGQACEISATCLLGGYCYPVEAIAETEVAAALISKQYFNEAMRHSSRFRRFVFSSIDKGLNELVALLEEVSFGQMDRRLARRLLIMHSDHGLRVTHRDLADELGTAREVVSRLLKEFERHAWVRLHRGRIEIIDQKGLQEVADRSAV